MPKITITIHDKKAVEKLTSLKHSKGKYIEGLILKDIRFELLEVEVKDIKSKLEGGKS